MTTELSVIISNISKIVKSTDRDIPHIIFVSIGSAAATRNLNGLVDDENYHQYPQFLQNIHNQIRGGHIHIILIDPELENPPYITQDHSKSLNFEKNTDNYYTSKNKNYFHVYTMNKCVFVDDGQFSYPEYVNITNDLATLNNLCMEESILMIYNDFSGRANKSVAELYDYQIKMHLDHIIYGLSARKHITCYINLLHPDALFTFKITERNRVMIKVFNVYNYLFNNDNYDINYIIDEYGIENIEIICAQIQCALDNYSEEFKITSLSILRLLYNSKKNNSKPNLNINDISNKEKHKIQLTHMLESSKYEQLYDYVFNIYASELDNVCKLKNNNMSGHKMLRAITYNDDPYKWYNELRNYF